MSKYGHHDDPQQDLLFEQISRLRAQIKEIRAAFCAADEKRREHQQTIADVESDASRYKAALDWMCKFYCEWYDKGEPSIGGGAAAYEMVSHARATLKGEKES